MPKRGENIYKRKDGRWEGRYKSGFKPDGNVKYISVYSKSYAEVRKIIAEKRSKADIYCVSCKMTVKELFKLWLENIRLSVKESTYANYVMKLEKHILPYFQNIRYEKLTVDILNKFVDTKLSEGLSAKYVYDIAVLIRAVSKFARKYYGYADKAEFMKLPRREPRKEKLMLSSEQHTILIEALKKDLTPSNTGVLLAAFTGIRLGELCALKWSDINFGERIITVRKTMQRIKNFDGQGKTKIVITLPKSRTSLREIPVPDWLLHKLKLLSQSGDSYFLTGSDKFIEPRTMQYRFKNLLKKLSLPCINFHTLRHMFATRCISLGFDVKTLSEILGHSSVEMTLNRYVHSSLERKRQCMSLLSEVL